MIVRLFALANADIAIDGDFLERAADSPIRLGVLVGYVAGKPLGIVGTALLVSWLSRGRLRPTPGWGAVAGAGASAGVGVGFTVSLLVATLAFDGAQLEEAEEAKAGILLGAARTLVECGDFKCPYRGRAERAVRELLRDFAGVRYVWRHLPLADVHPRAELAAPASEAAADQGAFW